MTGAKHPESPGCPGPHAGPGLNTACKRPGGGVFPAGTACTLPVRPRRCGLSPGITVTLIFTASFWML